MAIPFLAALIPSLLGLYQQYKQGQTQSQVMKTLSQGLSPEEIAEMRTQGTANVEQSLARRGLLQSGLLAPGLSGVERDIGLAKGAARRGTAPALASFASAQAQQPSFLSQLIPLFLKYGVKTPWGQVGGTPQVTSP